MKFSICNLGCKVNAYEAESIAASLAKEGWERVPFDQPADAALIFTCAVTNVAVSKSRKMMHRVKRLNPACITVMSGCYAQMRDGMLEEAEIIVGTEHKKRIPEYLKEYLEKKEKIRAYTDLDGAVFDNLESAQSEEKTRAYLKVQDGCNQFCSYCVIPYVRGRERSMEPERAVREACRLAREYNEIILTGIHTGRYGREYGVTLARLMEMILDAAPSIQRLRISSIEITEITPELIDLMKRDTRVARHLHIPLQSGCTRILKLMNRPYGTEEYYDKIEWIRKEIPDVAISCDLIVGFPGESEEDFAETCAFLRQCRFTFLHVFPYSLRKGTKAAGMPQVSPAVKKERASVCLKISADLAAEYAESLTGSTLSVMTERYTDGFTEGYDSHYVPVYIKGEHERGTLLNAEAREYRDGKLIAELSDYETE